MGLQAILGEKSRGSSGCRDHASHYRLISEISALMEKQLHGLMLLYHSRLESFGDLEVPDIAIADSDWRSVFPSRNKALKPQGALFLIQRATATTLS